ACSPAPPLRQWLPHHGSRSCSTSRTAAQTAPESAAPGVLGRVGLVPESAIPRRLPSQSSMREDWRCRSTVVDEKTSCVLLPENGCSARLGERSSSQGVANTIITLVGLLGSGPSHYRHIAH